MIAGLGITFYYMVTTQPWLRGMFGVTSPIELWWGIQPISAGVFGVPVGFAVIIIVSLLTPPPKRETQELVEHVRYPDLKLGEGLTSACREPEAALARARPFSLHGLLPDPRTTPSGRPSSLPAAATCAPQLRAS